MRCQVCFRHCEIPEGRVGFCGARVNREGRILPLYYGRVSSLALDPIEKKPLSHFHPGSRILSVGSLGCNLACPFCQNHEIAQREYGVFHAETEALSPEELAELAGRAKGRGNIGVAFTYNEPLVGYEYVRDTARRIRKAGMVSVLVTNGTAEMDVLREILPLTDAMNIDLKGFTDRYYEQVLGGRRGVVMDFIREAVKACHVELTTLIVPGENDTAGEMEEMCRWIAGLKGMQGGGDEIPLHVSRFFPRHHMRDRGPTDVKRVYELADTARRYLRHVHVGNC